MATEEKNKSPYDQSLDDALSAATGKNDAKNISGGFYRGAQNSLRSDSAKNFSNAEKNALNSSSSDATNGTLNSVNSISNLENTLNDNILNNVTGKIAAPAQVQAASKIAVRLKKYGPIGGILATVVIAGAFFLAGQSMMPFGVVNRLIEEYNSMSVSNSERSHHIFRTNLKNGIITSNQKAALKKQGILVKKNLSGNMYLEFKDSDGTKIKVFADESALPATGKRNITFDQLEDVLGSNDRAIAKAKAEFKTRFDISAQSFRGQSAGWYSKLTSKYLKLWSINRDRYHGFDGTKQGADEEFKSATKGNNSVKDSGSDGVGKEQKTREVQELDKDGKPTGNTTTETYKEKVQGKMSNGSSGGTDIGKIKAELSTKASSAAGVAGLANLKCAYLAATSEINSLAYVNLVSKALIVAGAVLEATQKTQIGEGSESPLSYISQALTEPDENGETALEGVGMAILFSGATGAAYNNHTETSLINAESAFAAASNGSVYDKSAFQECTLAKRGSAILNIGVDAVSIAFSGGAASVAKYIIKETIINLTASALLGAAFDAIIDHAATTIATDPVENMHGKFFGNLVAVGGVYYLANNHRFGGGSLGNKNKLASFWQAQDRAVARQAELERSVRSPFDITSQYTFLGSLNYQLAGFASNLSGLTGALSQMGKLVSTSIHNLTPGANASMYATTRLDTTEGDCPYQETIGAVCNYAGVGETMSDQSTMNADEQWIVDTVGQLHGSNGYYNATDNIKGYTAGTTKYTDQLEPNPGSELAKYATYCGQRQSPFGMADSNITMELHGSSAASDSGIPIISDLKDLIDSFVDDAEDGWITGENCVANSNNARWENEFKYYQRFLEDQRFFANLGTDQLDEPDDESTEVSYTEIDLTPLDEANVIAYNADEDLSDVAVINYYTGEPYDMSYEAQLGRTLGLTKEQTIAWLDTIDYYTELANYNPTNLGPVTTESTPVPDTGVEIEPVETTAASYLAVLDRRHELLRSGQYLPATTA